MLAVCEGITFTRVSGALCWEKYLLVIERAAILVTLTPWLTKIFQSVRQSITDALVLATPDLEQPYHLFIDASGRQDAERHYSVIELETCAIIKACLHFTPYLRGAKVTIHTDHWALKFLTRMKNSSPRLMRWAMALQPYNYTVEHLPGHPNIEADTLSRTWEDGVPTSGPFRGGPLRGGGCWAQDNLDTKTEPKDRATTS